MTYKIEKNVTPPRGKVKYPWKDMQPGDSFFVPASDLPKSGQDSLSRCAYTQFGRGNYRTVIEHGGVRVWRIK